VYIYIYIYIYTDKYAQGTYFSNNNGASSITEVYGIVV